ncbi:hypothetical protein CkaCkLH20_11821 [Colletotrichum karsti]|uniref:HNH nuclease domain-containing protein n=1 Tax=Colletotrichum karsti TaxID=1095194 RepID=A0A9P6LD37_9PEZI|nr:uncharacterized protein CkaCkLH20_11821 [Colletotrichum karsti]KAF9870719.1 hypothetical protein CkaCkLH20_11821 [Colletotrichum karsti]
MDKFHETQPEDLSYIDNMELRHTLFEELQTIRLRVMGNISPWTCVRREYITKAVWAAFWVTPIETIQNLMKDMKEGMLSHDLLHTILSSLQEYVPMLIRIVLGRNPGNASAAACKESECMWSMLGLLWGDKLVDDFRSALSVDKLNSPVNVVAMDPNVRYLWAKAKLSIEPYDWDDRSIRLKLRFLKKSKLEKTRHGRERFPWRNDLAMKPTEIVEDIFGGGHAEDDLVYEGTQQPIRDGDVFEYRVNDPGCRLDPRLLCLWHKVSVMASLLGCDERDEQACLEFAQGLADKIEEEKVEENEKREEIVGVWKDETAWMRGVYETEGGEEQMGASD